MQRVAGTVAFSQLGMVLRHERALTYSFLPLGDAKTTVVILRIFAKNIDEFDIFIT